MDAQCSWGHKRDACLFKWERGQLKQVTCFFNDFFFSNSSYPLTACVLHRAQCVCVLGVSVSVGRGVCQQQRGGLTPPFLTPGGPLWVSECDGGGRRSSGDAVGPSRLKRSDQSQVSGSKSLPDFWLWNGAWFGLDRNILKSTTTTKRHETLCDYMRTTSIIDLVI